MLGKESSLYSLGDLKFLGDAALSLRPFGDGAALCLDGMGDFIEADQRKRVAVDVFEAGKDAAPDGRFATVEHGLTARRLDAPQLGNGEELDPAARPFAVFGDDIVGNKDHIGVATDQRVLFGVRFRRNKSDDGFSVGRSDGKPAFTRLQDRVGDQPKAEPLEIEAQAQLLIADKDLHAVNAKDLVQRWLGGRTHRRDYKAELSTGRSRRAVWQLGGRYSESLATRKMKPYHGMRVQRCCEHA